MLCQEPRPPLPVNGEAKQTRHEDEDGADGGPDHDTGKEPHEHDPEEGERAAAQVGQPDHPPGVLEVVEHALTELSKVEEGAQG